MMLLPTLAGGQTIAMQQLSGFACVVKILATESDFSVLSTTPEYWTAHASGAAAAIGGYVDQKRELCEFAYDGSIAPAVSAGGSKYYFVPLQPRDHNQFQKHILSFWKAFGDSISLIAIADKGRISGPADFHVQEPQECGTGAIVVYTTSANVDAGDRWGAVDVYVFDETRHSGLLVYSATYSMESCARSDTLLAAWVGKDGGTLRLIRQKLHPVPLAERQGDCRWEAASADTALVHAAELVHMR